MTNDSILVSMVQKQLDHIAQQMGWVTMRTGCSPAFSESHDFSCFISDGSGRTISQADGIPIHTGGGGFAVRKVLSTFAPHIADGDVFILSDPYEAGGNHLPDWTIIRPVFVDAGLAGFTCNRGHQSDIGGGAAGTYNSEATEIFHEGIRLPVLRLVERGVVREDLWRLLLLNSRCPDLVDGDLRAMLGATEIGARRYRALLESLGRHRARECLDAILDYGEARLRAEIARLKPGSYSAADVSDTDCFEDREVWTRVKMTVDGTSLTFDFTGTDPQTKGYKNSSIANTFSAVYMAVSTFFDASIPRNEGTYRSITVIAPEGTIVNALPPAAVTMCTLYPAHDIINACWKALGQAAPERSLAGWGRLCHPLTGCKREDGSNTVIPHLTAHPGAGALSDRDGFNTIGNLSTLGGLILANIEAFEQQIPMIVRKHEFRLDGGGPGMFRGGTGMDYEVDMYVGGQYSFRSESLGRPTGLGAKGGKEGASGKLWVTLHEGGEVKVPRYSVRNFGPLNLSILSAGGGGWGDPVDRDPTRVLNDVLDGIVSEAAAKEIYGVVIKSGAVDARETNRRRARARNDSAVDTERRGQLAPLPA